MTENVYNDGWHAVSTHLFPHTSKNMPATIELLQQGRYRINQPLDGSNSLYEAYDSVRETNVLVKEIVLLLNRVTTTSQQETLKADLANQAKTLTEITHDSLVHVHDFFSEIGRQYLVMEAVEGDDLLVLLERNKRAFALDDVIEWADQLLDAVNYLHTFQPSIIHRSIKPENINLCSNGKIKLLAFGLSGEQEQSVTTALRDISSDSFVNYAPLEQIWESLDAASQKVISNSYDDRSERLLKEPADARSDIYSLGATLYHLVTGRMPVDPLERSIELLDGNADPLKAPHTIDPKIPKEISEVLMRALEIKRENRFDSAVIMRQVIRTAMVRIREREADEVNEQKEAAEDIRRAEEMRLNGLQKNSHQAPLEVELEQKRVTKALEQQELEVEKQRLEEEHLAAEAEMLINAQRVQREEEAAAKARLAEENRIEAAEAEAARVAVAELAEAEVQRKAEDARAEAELAAEAEAAVLELSRPVETAAKSEENDLLDISTEPAAKDESAIENENLDDILDSAFIEIRHETDSEDTADVAAYKASMSSPLIVAEASVDDDVDLGGLFAVPASGKGKGINIPVVAGIAVLVLALAGGGFFFMSSESASAPVAAPITQAEPPQPIVPAVNTIEAQPSPVDEPATIAATSETTAPVATQSTSRSGAAPASLKPKKTVDNAPKPAVQKKKAVTVDDLINDN